MEEEELQKMPYLKVVILEGLRHHPPAHFVAYHSLTQDITFEAYVIPKKGSINFMISHMNWNPKIWEDPMEFKIERFLNSKGNNGDDQEVFDFDITGSREGDEVDLSEKREFAIVMKNPLKVHLSPR